MEDRRSSHGVSDEQIDPSLANVGLTNQPNRPSDDEMVGALEGADDGNLWGSEDEDEEGGFQQVAEVHGQTDSRSSSSLALPRSPKRSRGEGGPPSKRPRHGTQLHQDGGQLQLPTRTTGAPSAEGIELLLGARPQSGVHSESLVADIDTILNAVDVSTASSRANPGQTSASSSQADIVLPSLSPLPMSMSLDFNAMTSLPLPHLPTTANRSFSQAFSAHTRITNAGLTRNTGASGAGGAGGRGGPSLFSTDDGRTPSSLGITNHHHHEAGTGVEDGFAVGVGLPKRGESDMRFMAQANNQDEGPAPDIPVPPLSPELRPQQHVDQQQQQQEQQQQASHQHQFPLFAATTFVPQPLQSLGPTTSTSIRNFTPPVPARASRRSTASATTAAAQPLPTRATSRPPSTPRAQILSPFTRKSVGPLTTTRRSNAVKQGRHNKGKKGGVWGQLTGEDAEGRATSVQPAKPSDRFVPRHILPSLSQEPSADVLQIVEGVGIDIKVPLEKRTGGSRTRSIKQPRWEGGTLWKGWNALLQLESMEEEDRVVDDVEEDGDAAEGKKVPLRSAVEKADASLQRAAEPGYALKMTELCRKESRMLKRMYTFLEDELKMVQIEEAVLNELREATGRRIEEISGLAPTSVSTPNISPSTSPLATRRAYRMTRQQQQQQQQQQQASQGQPVHGFESFGGGEGGTAADWTRP